MNNSQQTQDTSTGMIRPDYTHSGRALLESFTPEEQAFIHECVYHHVSSPCHPTVAASFDELQTRISYTNVRRHGEGKQELRCPSLTTFTRVVEAAKLFGGGPCVPPGRFARTR